MTSVYYGGNKFVALFPNAYNYYYTSDDGISWTQNKLGFTTSSKTTYVCYGDGKFVVILSDLYNTNTAAYSTDGLSWTTTTLPAQVYWHSVCYGTPNGSPMFVAISNTSTDVAYSTDGETWSNEGAALPSSSSWTSVCYGGDKFVAVGNGVAAYSTDGMTWDQTSISDHRLWSVCYGAGKFVAVPYSSNKGAYGTDGINWIEMTLPTSTDWKSVCYGDGVFVAVSYESTSTACSNDGINWTESDKINSTGL